MRLTAILLIAFVAIDAPADERLEGAWERVSLSDSRTGETPEAGNRKGLLIMAHGHYSMMTMNAGRRYLGDDAVARMTANQEVEYLREWLDINAHAGRYDVRGRTLTWYRDISEDPGEVGTITKLGYEWRGDLLVLRFALPNGDAYDWVWKRL